MMKKEKMIIQSAKSIAHETIEMVLSNDYISRAAVPGQFLHLSLEGHTLRRPISIADVDKTNGTVTILFKIIGSGTAKLASYVPGMQLDVLGPGGNGFPVQAVRPKGRVLLIGGGIGVPPLYYLGKALKDKNVELVSILGFQSSRSVFYEDSFGKLGETIIVTNDGSQGSRGFVTDVIEKAGTVDSFYSCGPLPMLKAITGKMKDVPGYISMEERMGCGVGACLACVIPTDEEGGYKKICADGPVFHTSEVSL